MSRSLAPTTSRPDPSRNQRLIPALLMLLTTLLMAGPAFAADAHWYAAPNGVATNDCATPETPCTIQGAINEAGTYDTVHVAPGNYTFTNNRIRIEKEGLRLIGDHSPFAKPYATPPGAGQIAHGAGGNMAANASVLKVPGSSATASDGITVNGFIWVRNVKNVRIENLYIELASNVSCGFFCDRVISKEAIVAAGYVNGLEVVNNYIKVTGGTASIAIGVNVQAGNDSSVPAAETRRTEQFITIENNVIEPSGSSGISKRAIAVQGNGGVFRGNQVAATTQDMWIPSPSTDTTNPDAQRRFVVENNWFFGRLGLYISGGSGFAEPTQIRGNHFVMSTVSGDDTDAHSLRLMAPSAPGTIVEGNEFLGFRGAYRAIWIQSRAGVTIQDNTFTPLAGQSDFTAVLLGNFMVQTGAPSSPRAWGATFLRNTFNANGAPANTKGKAILLVNDNDRDTLPAPAPVVQIGDGTAANANSFDSALGWYVALDDRSCLSRNHITASGCNGSSSYAIGQGINYTAGTNNLSATQKRSFKWDVNAAGNSFGGVPMASMDQAQYDAVWAKTFDNHNKMQSAATVGNVLYDWTPPPAPPQVELTITMEPTNNLKVGEDAQGFYLSAQNVGGEGLVYGRITATRADGAPIPMQHGGADETTDALRVLTEFGDVPLQANHDHSNVSLLYPDFEVPLPEGAVLPPQGVGVWFRVPGIYNVTAEIIDAVDQNIIYGTTGFSITVTQDLTVSLEGANPVTYNASAQPLTFEVTPASNPAVADLSALVSLNYNGNSAEPINAGSYAVNAVSANADYLIEPSAATSYVIDQAASSVAWGSLAFDYDGQVKSLSATLQPLGSACSVTPASVGADIGSYDVSAVCSDAGGNYQSANADATATIGGGNSVHRLSDGATFASVATALADIGTGEGDTLQLAPGVYSGPIVLTKGVTLQGGVAFMDDSTHVLMAGPTLPINTVIDGDGMAGNGILIANGVKDARISGLEIRNFAGNCVYASNGNDGVVIEENIVHHCGGHGIYVNGGGSVTDVSIRNNAVHDVYNRGIVVWNGFKRDITIEGNHVSGPIGASAIALEDGTATGVLIQNNEIDHSAGGDAGIAIMQLTSGSPSGRGNLIRNNTITDPGRFGIALMIPNGTGLDSGDGSIVVEGNTITGGDNQGAWATDDRAGIQVIRRFYSAAEGQVDVTQGVIIRLNTVTDFTKPGAPSGTEGYGIVVEGVGSSVSDNILTGNDIGLQIQQGNPNGPPPGDANPDEQSEWFDRGNTITSCVAVGDNEISDSVIAAQRSVPATDDMLGGVHNETDGTWHCSINAAISAATAGDTLRVLAGNYAEDVIVNKTLTLLGARNGVAGFDAARDGVGETVLGGTLSVRAADVVVDGLTIAQVTASAVVTQSGTSDRFQFINNRVLDITGNGVAVSGTVDWSIRSSLFANVTGHAVRPHGGTPLRMIVDGNHFRSVFSAMQMIQNNGSQFINNVVDETVAYAVQIANSSDVVMRDNVIRAADLGVLLDRNEAGVAVVCNDIEGVQFGIHAMNSITAIAAQPMTILHNRVVAPDHLRTAWDVGETFVIGSNFYDGSAPVAVSLNGAEILVADALAANPIGSLECGNNAAVNLLAYAGTPQSVEVGAAFASDLQARVVDVLGGAVAGEAISFSAPTSGASAVLASSTGVSDFNGVVATAATANTVVGAYKVAASSGAFTAVEFDLNNTVGTATVNVTSGSFAFDGTAHAVTVTTVPAGLESDVQVVYVDTITSATVITCAATDASCGPVAAGSYAVTATISGNPNYSGFGTGTLTISDSSDISIGLSGPARVEAGDLSDPDFLASLVNDGGMSSTPVFLRITAARSSGETVDAADVDVCIIDPSQGTAYGPCDAGSVWLNGKTLVDDAGSPAVQMRYPQLAANEIVVPGGIDIDFPAQLKLSAGDWRLRAELLSSDGLRSFGVATHTVQSRIATSITLSDLVQAFDGTAKSASVSTSPAGVNVDVTYSGGVAPSAVGTYALLAKVNQLYHDGADVSGSFEITRGVATVALSHLIQAADGSPKSVVVTTTPAGLPVSVSYDGSATAPSAEGSYAVVATVTDANYSGSASGSLQIVQGASDIALVLNGPVDPVHVGDLAQYAATMLANPNLHMGETFGYKVTLSKSNSANPLALADIASMEVFYQGYWVDAMDAFGVIPFALQPDGSLLYIFPQGVPGLDDGFPIEDASWTWNFRFSFADTGTYTTTAELVDGISHAPIDPAVTASIATVVEAALPPTDMHLILGGPAGDVTLGSFAEYNGTLLANPALHVGEKFFVKVTVGKSTGAMTSADFTAMQIFLGGDWVDGDDLGVVFGDDGHGNLVYLFPESQMSDGFPIVDAQWSWNFRFAYANAGVYTATAQLIPAYQAGFANPDVLASAAIATTVVAAPVITPEMKLLLLGPVDDVQVGSPAAYAGTLLANPDDFAGREFFVRVRLSKNGGADQMTVAELAKMELYLGGWQDATADLSAQFIIDGNELVYLFPQPYGAFPIIDAVWSWNFRFTYASAGLYGAVADVIDAADSDPLTALSLANASVQTNVVPQTSDIQLTLQGPVVGTVGEPLRYTGALTADPLPDASDLFFVHIKLSKNGGLSQMTAADLATMEISLDGGASWMLRNDLPLVQNGNFLEYDFPQPDLATGFPITGSWGWDFRFTYADEAIYRAEATVVTADGAHLAVSNTASVSTAIAAQPSEIALQLNGPVAGIEVGQPAQYVGTLRADPLPDPSRLFFVEVRLSKSSGTMQVSDLSKMELYNGGVWEDATTQLQPAFAQDGNDLVYLFPKPVLDDGFPINEAEWSWQFRFTYADAATYTATARVLDASDLSAVSASMAISTEVAPPSPNVSLQINGPVAGVQTDVPAAYIGRLLNAGPALGENVLVKVRVELDGGTLGASDVSAEVWNGSAWEAGSFNAVAGGLEIDFPDSSGFGLPSPFDYTHQFRINYHVPGLFTASAQVVGVDSSSIYAQSSMFTQVVPQSANVSMQLNGPVAGVEVDVPAAYIGRLTNHGPALTENAYVKVRVELDGGTLAAGDVITEVYFGGGWIEGQMTAVNDGLEVDFPDSSGFPIDAGFDYTHQFRITYKKAGVFNATATLVGANSMDVYATSAMYTEVVPRSAVTASVLIDPASLQVVYDGTPHAATVSSTPVVQAINVTYDGSNTAPSNAGVYVVVATVIDPVYVGSASAILVIDKAQSTVTINPSDLNQSAGMTHAVGATANPMTAGASIAVTYNGSATLPSTVGSYTVVASLVDPNFIGSASAILIVGDGAQVSISIDSAPAMALVAGNAPYTDMLEYIGTVGNAGAQTSQAVHFELEVLRIDDGNGSGGQPMAIDIDDVLACVYDPSGWAAQDPDHHYGCPQDYNSLFLSQTTGSLNGRPSTTFRYPNLAQNDQPLPTIDPASAMPPVLFAFKRGQYQVHASVVGSDGMVYATATAGTTVPDVAIGYNGPTSGQVEDALLSQSTLTNSGGRVDGNVIVRVTLSDAGNAPLSMADATLYYQLGGSFMPLPWTQAGGNLVTYYGPGTGFPLEDGHNATTSAQGIFHREGSYSVLYEVVDIATQGVLYASSAQAVTIGANLINFDVAGLNPVYTGAPLPVTVAPASVPHTVIYEPMMGASCPSAPVGSNATAPTDAGSYCVYVAAPAPYSGSWSGTLVIAKATGTISIDGAVGNEVDRGFDGSAQVVSATTDPTGLTYRMTYNGDSTAPSAAGSYTLLASIDDPNYSGIVTGTLIISAQNGASIVLDEVDLVDNKIHRSYTGSTVAAVSATTTPANVSYAVTYIGDGSTVYPLTATPPTNVGQYHVVATTIDANYGQVSAAGTLVIEPQTASITLDAATLMAVYNGSAHAVTATTSPAGIAYSVTYNGLLDAPVAAGSYVVVASITDANYATASVTDTLVISAVNASIVLDAGALNAVYDGNAHAVTATTNPAGLAYTVTYDGLLDAPVAAGSYAVVATITDPNHSGATASGTLVISAVNASVVLDAATLSALYDGNAHAVTATTTPAGLAYTVTYAGGSTPINAGSYAVQATITAPGHTGSASGTLVIAKAAGEVLFGQTSFQFDGASHGSSARIAQEPANVGACTLLYAPAMPIEVSDSSTVTANCEGVNYSASASAPLQITAKPITLALAGTGSFPYTGTAYAATASVTGEVVGFVANVAIDYNPGGSNAPVAVGSYGVTATVLAGGNYSASPATGVISIGAANATVQLTDLGYVWDGSDKSATATTTPAGLAVTISYDGSATLPNAAGSYNVVASISEAGYNGFASGTLVIAKAQAAVTLSDLQQAYDGSPKSATVTTSPVGLDVDVLYDGSAAVPSAVGSYTVQVTVTDANHSGSASGTLRIGAGNAELLTVNGGASFNGIAGQPLAGALPSVKVTDGGGNPVAGVAVTFAAAANSGVLSGAVQTTDGSGIATLGGWILDATPGTNMLSASAAGVADAVAFTAEGAAGTGALTVTITDGRTFAKFGQALTYTMTVGNAGSANLSGIEVENVLPAELDAAGATWQCIAINGATCANGSGDLLDTINLPAGSSVVYLLNTTAVRGPSDRITNTITVTSGSGEISATDITDVVLFRNGFELGGDGSQSVGSEVDALGDLDGLTSIGVRIDMADLGSLNVVSLANAADGSFRVEAIVIDAKVWLRLVARTAEGEQATAWASLAGDYAMLALEGSSLLLAGTNADLSIVLERSGAFSLQQPLH